MLAVAALVVAGGAHVSFRSFRGLFEPAEAGGEAIVWEDFDPVRLEALHEAGTNVMVDWTADWCPNCKFVEKFVLESEEIRALIEEKGIVMVKADITRDDERTRAMKRLQVKLGSRSIPFLGIFPGNDPYRPHTLRDIYTRGQLREILESLP